MAGVRSIGADGARPAADGVSPARTRHIAAGGNTTPWLTRYARLLVIATLFLVAAGGMVTSTGSGLAVPDWPTTYGYSMFSFPLGKMVGGIFYEHGHRLIATTVGMLTIGLVIWLWRVEPRRWVRRLGLAALGVVVFQGLLGGITVLLFLPDAISISHAGLAQVFFCLTIAIAVVVSPTWRVPASPLVDDRALQRRVVLLAGLVYLQILIGATMRHTGAGLAIPDFPLAFGGLLPPDWTGPIAVHFAHRVGALVVTVAVLMAAAYIHRVHGDRPELVRPAWLLVFLVSIQVSLGALVILTGRQPVINTLHVAIGASVLGTTIVLALRAFRIRFADVGAGFSPPDRPADLSAAASAKAEAGPYVLSTPPSRLTDLLVLTKVRVNALVVATTAGGYYLGARGNIDLVSLAVTCLGTALVAGGAAAINQVDERDTDRLMARTRQRPVAEGRIGSGEGRAIAVALSITGLVILWAAANLTAMLVAFATLVSYAFVYTPLKRRTSLATVVGAVPGALPPLIGWAAARGTIAEPAPWALFLLMFLWQLPHFLAIAWIYREDYARAGLPMLSVVDRDGVLTGRQATLWAATLVPFSVLPYLIGLTGPAYGAGAIVLGAIQLGLAVNFAVRRTNSSARGLFYGSITYLPMLWMLMVIGKKS